MRLHTAAMFAALAGSPALLAIAAGAAAAFEITSPAFASNGAIPAKYTCEGGDVSPPLAWTDPPAGTKSFALIVDDPDAPDPAAPRQTWVHWVVVDLPADARALAEGAGARKLPVGARAGKNDFGRVVYTGPCPPVGRHRYMHKLYALDTTLAGVGEPTKAELERAMEGHVLGRAELVGTYQKSG
jgi:Raf kinase inhibitor-like YbhB/YbcL family protein